MPTPTFQGPIAEAFSYPYASSLRNSQVAVRRKRSFSVQRRVLQSCEVNLPGRPGPPFGLVVSPNARHAIFNSSSSSALFDAETGCTLLTPSGDPVALDDEAHVAGTAFTWERRPLDQRGVSREALVRRIEGPRYSAVVIDLRDPRSGQADGISLRAGSRFLGVKAPELGFMLPGRHAVAAIGPDFTIVMASDNGLLQVWPPHADAQYRATLGAERNIGVAATWISLIPPHIMVIAPDGAGSKLQVFTGDTTPVYSLTVPFEVLQPAIAGSGTRVYLAGKGLAALDDGKVTWAHESSEPLYASSFEDGSLAVANGKRLDFLRPDGTVDQSFPTEEPLVAPPAIAADGSVWAASATALYIAR
jgi:hypothetical protein